MLVSCGFHVKVLDNLSTGKLTNILTHLESGKAEFIEGDITDSQIVKNCVRGIAAVIHLAAITSVPYSVENPGLTHKTNVTGTLNLLKSSIKEKVRRFVFISSCAVYGEPLHLPIDEQHPLNPISPYAKSKLEAEQLCLDYHKAYSQGSVILRLFNVYGPRQGTNDYSGVIIRFINRIMQNLPPVIYGDGLQTRDFINVQDVVTAILNAMGNTDANAEAFNVGSGKPTTIRELAETILGLSGAKLQVTFEKPRFGDIRHSHADIMKAKEILGFEPRIQLKDGLCTLLAEQLSPSNRVFTRHQH
jgi:UDP-glucose 4-epimerase